MRKKLGDDLYQELKDVVEPLVRVLLWYMTLGKKNVCSSSCNILVDSLSKDIKFFTGIEIPEHELSKAIQILVDYRILWKNHYRRECCIGFDKPLLILVGELHGL